MWLGTHNELTYTAVKKTLWTQCGDQQERSDGLLKTSCSAFSWKKMNMHCLGWNGVLDSYSLKMLIQAHEILALFTCWYQSVWSLATSPGACVFLLLGNLDKGMSPSEQDKQCLVYVMQMKLFILAWLHVGSRVDLCWLSLSWICRKDYKVNLTLWGRVTYIYASVPLPHTNIASDNGL